MAAKTRINPIQLELCTVSCFNELSPDSNRMLALERHLGQILERCPRSRYPWSAVMPNDPRLQLVERQIRESEERVYRQRMLVDLRQSRNQAVELSMGILRNLEDALALHRQQLTDLQSIIGK